MGKGGRIACIFTPMALTIASLVCLVLIEISGWGKTLPSYYFMKVNFTDLSVSSANILDNSTDLTVALEAAKTSHALADLYEIHLWNYCTSDSPNGTIDYCTPKQAEFAFNLIDVWHLNGSSSGSSSSYSGALGAAENELKGETEELENKLLGASGKKAYDAYKKAAKIMFILYAVAFWTTLATIVLGIFAIFSRWGSFFTWIFSLASSLVNLAAVAVSTALFAALVEALKGLLDPYNVDISLGYHALAITWLSVVFSWAATLFWLLSICCCSGRSNPHHRSNKGGLWNAEPKGMGYGDYGRARGMRVEKTGGYERVASPFLGHAENEQGDRVPLADYPQQQGYSQGPYEPFRHS